MDIKTIDSIKRRIWFWKDSKWSSESKSDQLQVMYKMIQERVREVISNIETGRQDISFYFPASCIFLVDTPMTFGHSQLVILGCEEESTSFSRAATIIEKKLFTFKQTLNPKTIYEYPELADFTLTRGCYVKTLILRVSAQEDCAKEYKVHLVPYFKSHASLCRKRYTAVHDVNRKERGGLLGWLGERETVVESWKKGCVNLDEEKFNKTINNVWKLPDLAEQLAGTTSVHK